ncbi:MAG: Preprotein translocase [Candidatus Saccharibacteria bacterium]|nr:Preprotein translocase [Candidatus Saccharibacteria bacterium]
MFVDTHCHIHESDYSLDPDEVILAAHEKDVSELICVGTSEMSSKQAIEFAATREGIFATVGVHPHDTKDGYNMISELAHSDKVVAVGEIGLDYFYTNSPREMQIQALKDQIEVALAHNLPIIFHVRESFDDFWPIFDSYPSIRGELHSFTDSKENLAKALERGLYIGVNGISTFTKDEAQQSMFDSIPLNKLLLETDAPFLTPAPLRGKINQPAYVRNVAEYHAKRRGISETDIAQATTANAHALFAL